ncbi:enolase C-terminal domain-like protein [Leifsonia sp. NPDC058230]|uniref:enolase C-terminal domain-like protein n=1 Tax=Leifsonia sp. NPDC058230 TaxID=3346391 RepID=UPI0036DB5265
MRITGVTVEHGPSATRSSLPWRDGLPRRSWVGQSGFLRISTDEGIDGYAAIDNPRRMQDLVDKHFATELIGQDPLAREYLWHRMWEVNRLEYMPTPLFGTVDIALWDLAGKAAGMPVHSLLGTFRRSIPAYASTVTFGSIAEYLDVIDQCLDLGYRAVKLHAWGDARRDAQLSQAVRDHVGPGFPLMFDGSAGFDLNDAVYLGRALSEVDYLWYEEPMREFSVTSYKWLGERVDVPLLVAEVTEGAHLNVADFIMGGSASMVRTSSGFKGGITGAMRIAHLADSFQMRAEVHGAGLANEHLCMAIPNTTYYESLVTTNPVRQDARLTASAELVAPEEPGIGWERLPEQAIA